MRKIEYLSPSAISLYEANQDEFYMKYLADQKPPNFPQTQPMSIGSAFDAYVKSYLHERLYGVGNDPRFALEAILEAQCEVQHRDWARSNGAYVFDQYKQSGALSDLMLELQKAQGEPRFEFEVRGAVHGYREGVQDTIHGVTLLGKPDVHYVNQAGVTVILDFKVNGYCSQSGVSPMQGYLRLRSAGKTNHGMHRNCQAMQHLGMLINIASYLETFDKSWAQQLAIYAWLTGCPVGSDFITAIDQVCCKPNPGGLPELRFAEHRTRVSNAFQWTRFNRACEIWEITHSDHVFRDRSKEASIDHCRSLDERSVALGGDPANSDTWFASATRV